MFNNKKNIKLTGVGAGAGAAGIGVKAGAAGAEAGPRARAKGIGAKREIGAGRRIEAEGSIRAGRVTEND
jgi:hypothetical protein